MALFSLSPEEALLPDLGKDPWIRNLHVFSFSLSLLTLLIGFPRVIVCGCTHNLVRKSLRLLVIGTPLDEMASV